MKKCLFCIFLFTCIRMNLSASLAQDITQARLALYQRSSAVDVLSLQALYQRVQAVQDIDEQLWLFARLGVLFCETYLYHDSAFPLVKLCDLSQIYKEYRKKALASKSSRILRESGEFSFYMMRLFPKKRLAYLMDARRFFLKALSIDKKDLKTKISLGKWWVYRIMNIRSHEINHPLAQVDKYLSDENIDALLRAESDPWQRINLAHCLYLRAIADRRALRMSRAHKDEEIAQSLLPSPSLHALMQNSHANTPTTWI